MVNICSSWPFCYQHF